MKKLLCVLLAAAFVFALQPAAHAATPVSKSKYYARSTLSGWELNYYDALYAAMPKRTAVEADQFGVAPGRSRQLLQYMYNDAPEILGYYIVLGMPQEDAVTEQVNRETQAAMACLNANMDEADKARALYLYLAQIVTLDTQAGTAHPGSLVSEQSADSGNILGGLLGAKVSSLGVARTYQYLLYQAGIPSYTVTGSVLGKPHAWDMLQIGGEWYFADLALDMDAIKKGGLPAYFLLDHSIFNNHAVNPDENPPLPAANSRKYMEQADITSSLPAAGPVSPSVSAADNESITPVPAAAPAPTRYEQMDANADAIFTWVLVAVMIGLVALVIVLIYRKRKDDSKFKD